MMKRVILFVTLFILFTSPVFAATTYYVDYASGADTNNGTATGTPWKYAPGMSGCASNCASASLASGDTVVLKGGVTWQYASHSDNLYTIGTSGITVQGGQQLGSPWGSGYPVLDGEGNTSTSYRYGIFMQNKNNITIDGIKVINIFDPNDSRKGFGIVIDGGDTIEIKNCWIETKGLEGLSVSAGAANVTHLLVHDNTFVDNARCTINSDGQVDVAYHIDDFQFYDNLYLGFTSGAGGYHADGLMIQGNNVAAHGYGVRNTKIYRNKFYGQWGLGGTGVLFFSGCTSEGSGFTGTATVAAGAVTAVAVTASGERYDSAPLIHFIGGGGSGATAHANMVADVSGCTSSLSPSLCCTGAGTGTCVKVNTVTVDSGGSGYTSTPAVTHYPSDCKNQTGSPVGWYSTQNTEVYNNVIVVENSTEVDSMMNMVYFGFGHHENVKVYNNTISYDAVGTLINQQHAMLFFNVDGLEVKNNIMSGVNNGLNVDTNGLWGTYTVDYNMYYNIRASRIINGWPAKGTNDCRTMADCRTQFKNSDGSDVEANGSLVDPKYVTLPSGGVTGSGDFHLQASSPAIGDGVQLNTEFTDDLDKVTRGTVWDIGAYEYEAGADPDRTLTVTLSGNATGESVSSSPAGISCGSTCNYDFDDSIVVTLTATHPDNRKETYTGDGTNGVVTMSAAKAITATFSNLTGQATIVR